jgi:hypothetical protein
MTMRGTPQVRHPRARAVRFSPGPLSAAGRDASEGERELTDAVHSNTFRGHVCKRQSSIVNTEGYGPETWVAGQTGDMAYTDRRHGGQVENRPSEVSEWLGNRPVQWSDDFSSSWDGRMTRRA